MKNNDKKLKKIKAAVAASGQMKEDKFNLYTIVPYIAGFGLLCAIYLTYVYITANFIPNAAPSLCSINELFDCDAVARGKYATMLGVPNAVWGCFFYIAILFLYYAKSLKNLKLFKFMEVFENPRSYIYLLSLFSVFVALCLFTITVLSKQICFVCCITWCVDIALFICSINKTSFVDHVINSINDFFKAITNKWYAASFALVVLVGVTGLIAIEKSQIFIPSFTRMLRALEGVEVQVTGNELGNQDATVVINEFTDIQCPFCAYSNLMMNKITQEYDNVRVIHHDFPLDNECNSLLKNPMHQNSCLYSRYGIAAKNQGKFWPFISMLFKNNSDLTEDKVLEYAKNLGLDTEKLKKDAYSEEVKKQLLDEVNSIIDMKITSTPTYIINGKKHNGLFEYNELEKTLKELGAVKKR